MKIFNKAAVLGASLALAGASHAADPVAFTMDVTSVTTTIANGVTTLSAIGLAVLSLVVIIKMFKWAQRVLG